jgi:hypothetical protein
VSEGLGVSVGKVHQLLRDGQLLAVRRSGELVVPRLFFAEVDGRVTIAKHVTGLLAVLHDGGFSPEETMQWLFSELDELGASPAELLHTDSAREVIRRAQALAL